METKNEQIKIKIAEVCGWEPYPAENVGATARLFNGSVWYRHAESNTIATPSQLPDYCNDLNAMHDAEKSLTLAQFWNYADLLKYMVVGELGEDTYITATARQRAEAFLRTLNKYPNNDPS